MDKSVVLIHVLGTRESLRLKIEKCIKSNLEKVSNFPYCLRVDATFLVNNFFSESDVA